MNLSLVCQWLYWEEGTVYVYSIDRGNVVYKGSSNLPFDITELIVSGCGDASQTLLLSVI